MLSIFRSMRFYSCEWLSAYRWFRCSSTRRYDRVSAAQSNILPTEVSQARPSDDTRLALIHRKFQAPRYRLGNNSPPRNPAEMTAQASKSGAAVWTDDVAPLHAPDLALSSLPEPALTKPRPMRSPNWHSKRRNRPPRDSARAELLGRRGVSPGRTRIEHIKSASPPRADFCRHARSATSGHNPAYPVRKQHAYPITSSILRSLTATLTVGER
jgi:hypothetical protein